MLQIVKNLNIFFEKFINKPSIFKDKNCLQSIHNPNSIPHREAQIEQIADTLAPCLRNEKPSNLFIYGKTGTGKTLSVNYVADELMKVSKEKNIPLDIIYVNCKLKKTADTEYRLISQFLKELGIEIPATGLPTDEVYKIFFNYLDKEKKMMLFILDEIDQLVKKSGDEILYNLTRINSHIKNSQVSLIGISNDLMFAENIDPRIKSSLSGEEIIFPPYNALQLKDILKQRAEKAFKADVLEYGVVEKCAAYAARDHGDARMAIELLRVSAELAERKNLDKVKIEFVDLAQEKIERERIVEVISTQPKQYQIILYSSIILNNSRNSYFFTGELYELYKKSCSSLRQRPLTQRRVSDIISELDMLGILNARIISKGRYGRTREVKVAIPNENMAKVKGMLEYELRIK